MLLSLLGSMLMLLTLLVPHCASAESTTKKNVFAGLTTTQNRDGVPVQQGDGGQCFCKLKGQIDDCLCSVDTVDYFNNMKIFPRLQSLLQKPFFRYFRYNPRKPCPFWNDSSGKCGSSNCFVKPCQTEEVPTGLQKEMMAAASPNSNNSPHSKYTEETQNLETCEDDDGYDAKHSHDLNSKVDETISEEDRVKLAKWQKHDSSLQDFCDIDNDHCPDCEFVDLTINPERFTGYSGEASHRIWRTIYEENCFKPPNSDIKGAFSAAFLQDSLGGLCLEKRAFYRAVSGLHTSITIHLCANYLQSEGDTPFAEKTFGPPIGHCRSSWRGLIPNQQTTRVPIGCETFILSTCWS